MIAVRPDPTCLEKHLTKKKKKKEDTNKIFNRIMSFLLSWMFNHKPGGLNIEAKSWTVRIWNALPSNLLFQKNTPRVSG